MTTELMYTHLPYCIKHLGNKQYIILNRNYKPLGTTNPEWTNYATHPSVVKMNITAKQAAQLSWNNSPDTENIYLYENASATLANSTKFSEYMTRLGRLAKLKAK